MIRGEQARELARVLVGALQPMMPPDVIVSVRGKRKYVHLTSRRTSLLVETLEPGDPGYDEALRASKRRPKPVAGEPIKRAYFGGSWSSIPGFGTSRLFKPNESDSAREAMVDALRTLQRIVAQEIHGAWPAPEADVRSRYEDGNVWVWFETPTGERFDVGAFPAKLATRR